MKAARFLWAAPFLATAAVLTALGVVTVAVLLVVGLGYQGALNLIDNITA